MSLDVRVVVLDEKIHKRADFRCGEETLEVFLATQAAQAARAHESVTRVLVADDDPGTILGFYTLVAYEYRDGEMDPTTAKALKIKNLHRIPMILLGRLAICQHQQNRGLGRALLKHALKTALLASRQVGGLAVITDPMNTRAQSFYEQFEFTILRSEPAVRLILPMRVIERNLSPRSAVSSSFASVQL